MNLRDYQEQAVRDVEAAFAKGYKRVLLTLPTGSGKTATAVHMINERARQGQKTLFIIDRLELLSQTIRHLEALGLHTGVMQAENTSLSVYDQCVVSTIQTLNRRRPPEDVRFVVIDEAHVLHQAHIDLMASWNNLEFLGLSATPLRKDLGRYFEKLVKGTTVRQLIDAEYLVKSSAFCPSAESMQRILDDVGTRAGDFIVPQLSRKMRNRELVGDIVRTYKQHGQGRRALCFCCDVAHAEAVSEEFQADGINGPACEL